MQAASYSHHGDLAEGTGKERIEPLVETGHAPAPAVGASDEALAKTMPPHSATCAGHKAEVAQLEGTELLFLGHARQLARGGVAPLVIGAGHEPPDGSGALEQGDAAVAAHVVEGPERVVTATHDGERDTAGGGGHVGAGRRQFIGVRHQHPRSA